MKRRESAAKASAGRFSCLTEMSVTALIVGALGLSTLLWLAIFAVI